MINPRAIAATTLIKVITKKISLTTALDDIKIEKNSADTPLIKEFCYGVCRWYFQLDKLAQQFIQKPLKEKDQDIYLLLLIGLYQLIYMRIPPHAAVNETVNATSSLKKLWAKKFLNGILRNFLRDQARYLQVFDRDLSAKHAHPQWLIAELQKHYPSDWEAILFNNNQRPPMTLRVNSREISRNDYVDLLARSDIAVELPNEEDANAIVLKDPMPVEKIPGFQDGLVSIQDAAAQLAAGLIFLEPKLRVLDACAAPGGKTAHILEIEPDLAELVAIDIDAQRIKKISETLHREKLSAKLVCADAASDKSWWDGKLFDRILIDAPCSATGVIRRHPDIKLLRTKSDIKNVVQVQRALLENLWPLLKPSGILLYVTCSVFPAENEDIIAQFLQGHPDAREDRIEASWGIPKLHGRQILPGENNRDGFYYCRVIKI